MPAIQTEGTHAATVECAGYDEVKVNGETKAICRIKAETPAGEHADGTIWLGSDAEKAHGADIMRKLLGTPDATDAETFEAFAGFAKDCEIGVYLAGNYARINLVDGIRLGVAKGADPKKSKSVLASLTGKGADILPF